KYAVEHTRVGQRTDYDKLILEVWTDGRLTPDDALLQASAILRHHLDVFVNFNEDVIEFDETPAGVSEENMKLKKLLNMSVNEIELSVRAANCLNNANITTVGQLAQKTEAEMLKYRNFGKSESSPHARRKNGYAWQKRIDPCPSHRFCRSTAKRCREKIVR